jgi:hypothetical protein
VKGLLVVLVIAVAIFLGIRFYKTHPSTSGGSTGGNPVVVNPVSSFPNPYSS